MSHCNLSSKEGWQIDKSRQDRFPEEELMKVGLFEFKIVREKSLVKFSISLPLADILEDPHMGLCAFRSPRMINGIGN